jgi:hypothetical protein
MEDTTSALDAARIVVATSAMPALPVKVEAQGTGWSGDIATLAVR